MSHPPFNYHHRVSLGAKITKGGKHTPTKPPTQVTITTAAVATAAIATALALATVVVVAVVTAIVVIVVAGGSVSHSALSS